MVEESQENTSQIAQSELKSMMRQIESLRVDLEAVQHHAATQRTDIEAVEHRASSQKADLEAIEQRAATQRSSIDAEIDKLRLEVDARVRAWHSELEEIKTIPGKSEGSSSLSRDMEQLARWMTALDSDVKSLRSESEEKEVRAANAAEVRLGEFRGALQEHKKEVAVALSSFQSEIERMQKKQDDDSHAVLQESNTLLVQMQSEMNSMHELFESGLAQDGRQFQQEALDLISSLQAEVEQLRQKPQEFGADASQGLSMTLQLQSDMVSLRTLLQEQQSDVKAMQQQLKERETQIDVEKRAMSQGDLNFQHESLQMMRDVQAEIEYLKQKHEDLKKVSPMPMQTPADLIEIHNTIQEHRSELQALQQQVSVQYAQVDAGRASNSQRDVSFQQEFLEMIRDLNTEVENLRMKHEDVEADLDKKAAAQARADLVDIRSALQAQRSEVEAVQQQIKEQNVRLDMELIGSPRLDLSFQQESLEMIRDVHAELEHLRQKHDSLGKGLASQDSSAALETQAELKDVRQQIQHQQALHDQAGLAQQIMKQTQRLEMDAVQKQLKEQRAELDALRAASRASAEVRETEASIQEGFEEQLQQHAEAVKFLNGQVEDLSRFTKEGLAAVHQLPMQFEADGTMLMPQEDSNIKSIKADFDALKLQIIMQQSLRDTEVTKKADELRGKLQEVLGTERESRMQDSLELRALIKNLYVEMARFSKIVKSDRAEQTVSEDDGVNGDVRQFESNEPLDIGRIEVTQYIGALDSDEPRT